MISAVLGSAVLGTSFLNSPPTNSQNFFAQENIVSEIAPAVQEFDGLLLDAPVTLNKLPDQETYKSWQGLVKSTKDGATGTTESISVVVTDLTKIENKPTADQMCDLHDRASRTRKGFAAQLFKSTKTEINGKPMIVVMGSFMTTDVAKKPINAYHLSACFSTDDKAYEVTWITYYGGDSFSNALKAVRNVNLKVGDTIHKPKTLFGTSGNYTFLGTPFQFTLPKPGLVDTTIKPSTGMAGRYLSYMNEDKWYATAEIAQYNANVTKTEPLDLLAAIGYVDWTKLEPKPEAKLIDGVYVFENIEIIKPTEAEGDNPAKPGRHARVDIATSGKYICAVVVSTNSENELPKREIVGLKK